MVSPHLIPELAELVGGKGKNTSMEPLGRRTFSEHRREFLKYKESKALSLLMARASDNTVVVVVVGSNRTACCAMGDDDDDEGVMESDSV